MEKKKQCQTVSLSTKIFSETVEFFTETYTFLSSLTSDPLFSIFITLYTLVLVYLPHIFLNLIFSPILISTIILLTTLLRLGSSSSNQSSQQKEVQSLASNPEEESLQWATCGTETESESESESDSESNNSKPFQSFMEWNVRAPLEVIYEEYEGEEEENEKVDMGMERMVSFNLYYPESDTEGSSDGDFSAVEGWDSPENMCFKCGQEERDDDGLIEIPLNGKRDASFQVEEENMIEIDISPTRKFR